MPADDDHDRDGVHREFERLYEGLEKLSSKFDSLKDSLLNQLNAVAPRVGALEEWRRGFDAGVEKSFQNVTADVKEIIIDQKEVVARLGSAERTIATFKVIITIIGAVASAVGVEVVHRLLSTKP